MSKRQQTGNSVTLFPFLAVLVCAMGALIFLLLVTTRRIRQQTLADMQVQEVVEEPAQDVITETPDEPVATPVIAATDELRDAPTVAVVSEPEPSEPPGGDSGA